MLTDDRPELRAVRIDLLDRTALARANTEQKQPDLRILNMLKKTGQRERAELADESQPHAENGREKIFAVEWLSTSIVHDLWNPLGAIYAAAEMMLVEFDAGPTQVKRLASNIYRAAGRMRELLADLNGIARGSSPTAEICDIGRIITAASAAASATTKSDNVEIVLDISERIELPVIRSHMERVFVNLIVNALEAMPTGGKLHITCRKANSYVLIEFEDTGPGIPRTIGDRLFEPFVTDGKQDGLGLGLAFSRQTLLNHGGDTWSEPAAGARFVVRLPLNRVGLQ